MAEIIPITAARSRRPAPAPAPARPRRKPITPQGAPLAALLNSWRLSLQGATKSPKTIGNYTDTAARFIRFLQERDYPCDAEGVQAEHVRKFLIYERERTSASSAAHHFRNLRVWFNWLIDTEGERTTASPVVPGDAPRVADKVRAYITEEEQRALLKVCSSNSFDDRRDNAILRVFMDNGVRVSGLANVLFDGVDLGSHTLKITLKGGNELLVPIVAKTAAAVDRYLRVRAGHPKANESPWLWLGSRGRGTGHFTHSGVRTMLARRGTQAGVKDVHPHRFRGTAAHELLKAGVHPDAVMRIMGWRTQAMLGMYTEELAGERAREMHAQLSPGNRR